MNKGELVAAISGKADDSSFSSTDILASLNRGVLDIAGGGPRNWGLPTLAPLPDLLSSATVDTDTNHNVAMPATYHRGLFRVTDSSGNKITVYDSFIKMMDDYDNLTRTGSAVSAVCLKGNTLYYNPIPTAAQTITLWFHRLPVAMALDASTPDGLPAHLHERLLVNYVLARWYEDKEDGVEGSKVNTDYYKGEFQAAMTDLSRFIGAADGEPSFIRDDADCITEDWN